MPPLKIALATLELLLLASPGLAAGSPSQGPALHASPGPSLVAGHFRLATPNGATVDSDDLAGTPYGIVFGFTHCPDVCPTTLSNLSTALANSATGDLRIYFVSVDPERDTPGVLAEYMANFDPRIVALTGSKTAVEEAIASFGVVARRSALPSGGYAYSHTAAILLVDGDGVIVDRMPGEDGPDGLANRLASRLGTGSPKRAAASR